MANLQSLFINSSYVRSDDVLYNTVVNNTSVHRNDSMASVSEVINYAIIVFGIFVITATILGNSLVILAIIIDKKLRRVGNIFIVNLAVSDVLVGAIVSPLSLVYQITGEWPFGRQLCEFWISIDIICCTASILNLCVISYDRYNAISQPLKYAKHRTTRRALILVILVWLYSVGIALPPLLGWRDPSEMITFGVSKCHITQNLGYTFYSTIGAFFLPLSVMVIFYTRIFLVTNSRGKQWVKGPGSSCRIQRRRSRNKKSGNNTKSACCFQLPCQSKQESASCRSVTTQTDAVPTRAQSLSSSIRRSTFDYSATGQTDHHRKALMFSPRTSTASTSAGEVVLEITQGRRKQMIHRRLYRQISNPTSDSSYTTSSTISTTAETSFSDSTSSSDVRTNRRASNVIYNLLAANIMAAEILRDSVKGVQFAPQYRPPLLIEEESEQDILTPREISNTSSRSNRRKRKNMSLPHERRAVKTLGIVVGCFILCWLPFFVVTVIKPVCKSCQVDPIVTGIVLWLGYCNSACNPIIYTFFNEDFRRAFRKLTTCTSSVSSPIYL